MNPRRTNKKGTVPRFRALPGSPRTGLRPWGGRARGGRAQTSSTPSSGANGAPNAFQFRGPRRQVFVCGVEFVGGESKNLLLSLVSFKTDFVDWTRATNSHSRDRIGKEATNSLGWRWSRKSDLNRRPADYESAALPTELLRPALRLYRCALRR